MGASQSAQKRTTASTADKQRFFQTLPIDQIIKQGMVSDIPSEVDAAYTEVLKHFDIKPHPSAPSMAELDSTDAIVRINKQNQLKIWDNLVEDGFMFNEIIPQFVEQVKIMLPNPRNDITLLQTILDGLNEINNRKPKLSQEARIAEKFNLLDARGISLPNPLDGSSPSEESKSDAQAQAPK